MIKVRSRKGDRLEVDRRHRPIIQRPEDISHSRRCMQTHCERICCAIHDGLSWRQPKML